jgi:CheY-like chemotaxis protein
MTSSAASGPLAHRRVLVVEDEYFIADDMARALSSLGGEVVGPVPTLDKALALVAAERVDAAVLDINLKGQTVFPVADALRERGVPFVFATGYDQSAVPVEYEDVPRWEKPFNPQDLAKMLPSIVHQS